MKNFTITCTINNNLQKFNVRLMQSSVTCFYIYKNNKWIGTLRKNSEARYSLISYSRFLISQTEVNAIGEQIELQTILHRIGTDTDGVLRAA